MPKSVKTPQKRSRDPYRKRKCKLCKLPFVPTTKNAKNADGQEFCQDAHRKEFWKYGSLPMAKMMARIEKRCREIAREELALFEQRLDMEGQKSVADLQALLQQTGHAVAAEDFKRIMTVAMDRKPTN
jgi:hypothetical protein